MTEHVDYEKGANPAKHEATIARLHKHLGRLDEQGWNQLLTLAARMPSEPFANTVLIAAERPHANQLLRFPDWGEAGRRVKPGEPSLRLFDRATPGHTILVWDITQTHGRFMPPADAITDPAPDALLQQLRHAADRRRIEAAVNDPVELARQLALHDARTSGLATEEAMLAGDTVAHLVATSCRRPAPARMLQLRQLSDPANQLLRAGAVSYTHLRAHET